ncbi:MAG: hypothetical protein J6T57_04660 [Alphaproteobacteria bacterium]|nr:hypothetical protein [Alphaproteobacteria bacterium]
MGFLKDLFSKKQQSNPEPAIETESNGQEVQQLAYDHFAARLSELQSLELPDDKRIVVDRFTDNFGNKYFDLYNAATKRSLFVLDTTNHNVMFYDYEFLISTFGFDPKPIDLYLKAKKFDPILNQAAESQREWNWEPYCEDRILYKHLTSILKRPYDICIDRVGMERGWGDYIVKTPNDKILFRQVLVNQRLEIISGAHECTNLPHDEIRTKTDLPVINIPQSRKYEISDMLDLLYTAREKCSQNGLKDIMYFSKCAGR